MKILYLSDDFPPKSYGGAGIVAFDLAKGVQDKGNEVSVICAAQDKSASGVSDYQGLKIFSVYTKYHARWNAYLGLYNPQTVAKVSQIIEEIKPDIVHAHNLHRYLSYACLKSAKQSGAKVFLTAHDAMSFHYGKLSGQEILGSYKVSPWRQFKKYKKRYNPFRNLIIRYYLNKYVDKIFSVSDALKKALVDNGIKKVQVLYNGVDLKKWQIDERLVSEFRQKFALAGKKVVMFGGRLSEAKGGQKIVLAMKKVVVEIPEAVLLVIGKKDEYAQKMLRLAENIGLDRNIIFTGWISGGDLIACYHASDAVVVPSLYLDPFPTVNLEAMACARPVVGTCFGGTKEVVRDGVSGYIVNPFNSGELADKVKDLLKNPQKAKQFGEAGRELIIKKFSLDQQVEAALRYYRELH